MSLQCAFPMYAAGAPAYQQLWQFVAQRLQDQGFEGIPQALEHPTDLLAHWLQPELLLSQTCGYPLTHALDRRVQLVGAFRYQTPGCEGILYRSMLVCRTADAALPLDAFRGRSVAYNSLDSQSGYNSLRALVAPWAVDGRFFGRALPTGAHRASLEAVRSGTADLAAIDCVSLALFQQENRQVLDGLRICGYTALAPGLPLVTSLQTPPALVAALQTALGDAMDAHGLADARTTLLIGGFETVALPAYNAIQAMEHAAYLQGYYQL
jgi:ABC-type phosphate/phosphonate transport system substrate-binding protein